MTKNDEIMNQLQCGYAQKRVLPLIMQGLTTMQVAIELGVTESAVKQQLSPLYKLTGLKNRKLLVAGLLARGWIAAPKEETTVSFKIVEWPGGFVGGGESGLPGGFNGNSK